MPLPAKDSAKAQKRKEGKDMIGRIPVMALTGDWFGTELSFDILYTFGLV